MAERLPDSLPPEAIRNAIQAFDDGAPHEFGPSSFYDLLYEGRRYPPKAIVGLAATAASGHHFRPSDFSGWLDSKCFKILWDAGFEIIFKTDNLLLPEQVLPAEKYIEGAVQQIVINRYERDEKARKQCIAYQGCICHVCGFDFEVSYGPIESGYIHVHHVVPLSQIGESYVVDPTNDLVPVCPNCHAMIHRKSPPYLIKELRHLLRQSGRKSNSSRI